MGCLGEIFDTILLRALSIVRLDNLYLNNQGFRQFVRYGTSVTFIYWFAKAPLIWFATEVIGIHYVMSSFLIGLLITIAGFFVEKFFVFRRESRDE